PTVDFPNPEDPNAFKLALELANKVDADLVLTDYSNLGTLDYVFFACVAAWIIMLGIRLYVINVKNKQ
ncbi:MAG: hypothetical protein II137_05855, partial [Anaerovibrio sp.]|nr:hypothetical protein [Anaerovibrio sp.]